MSTFVVAGPSITIPEQAIEFYGPPQIIGKPAFYHGISQVAYFFTVAALTMGVANIVWIPFAVKYGRRPVYIITFILYAATSVWCALAKSFGSMLAARTILGCAAGAAEVLGPLTIADIFFAHERGAMMV